MVRLTEVKQRCENVWYVEGSQNFYLIKTNKCASYSLLSKVKREEKISG